MQRVIEIPEPLQLRTDGDENTVEGWVVPYGEVADVADVTPDGVHRYREGFRAGSCKRMAQGVARRGNAGFIRLTLDHEHGIDSRVGCGLSLVERGSDGAWGSFKLYRSANLELVRSMIEDSHKGFSIEFTDVVDPEEVDGVVWRRQVAIPAVTLTPAPAYAGAGVASLRGDSDMGGAIGTPLLDEARSWLDEFRDNGD